MAIPDIDTLSDRVQRAILAPCWNGTAEAGATIGVGRFGSLWQGAGIATGAGIVTQGDIPSTPAVPTYATKGAIPIRASAGLRFLGAPLAAKLTGGGVSGGTEVSGTLILVDRLSHQGGLVGNIATSQTTNLPTAALTRSVSGEGVMACYEIYGAVGATIRNITATYTNSAGVGGRVSQPIEIGGSGVAQFSRIGTINVFALADGDTGVRSVESVQLDGSTGIAGNFGITLFRILAILPVPIQNQRWPAYSAFHHLGGNLPTLEADACLAQLFAAGAVPTSNFIRLHAWFNYD